MYISLESFYNDDNTQWTDKGNDFEIHIYKHLIFGFRGWSESDAFLNACFAAQGK